MFKFDTLDKKPSVWNIAFLSGILVLAVGLMFLRKPVNAGVVSILFCIYLVLVIICLVRAFFLQIRYNPYSYNTIYYAGFSLFLLTLLISAAVSVAGHMTVSVNTVPELIAALSYIPFSTHGFMIFSAPFIFMFSLGLLVANISLIRHEGKRPVNFLGILLAFLLVGGLVFLFISTMYATGSWKEVMIHDLWTNLLSTFYLYFEDMLIGTIIAMMIVIHYRPEFDKDYIIILGCGIRKDGTPTPLLRGRIDRALKFYYEQIEKTEKAPVLITSGGQGANEVISESACMKKYLLEQGIPEDHILQEDRSTSTYENMLYSREVIEKDGKPGKIAFSTTNYHVFRSGLMARRVKMRAVGIGSKTKWYYWPNAAVREFVGIITEHRLKQALILGGMIVIYLATTVMLYL